MEEDNLRENLTQKSMPDPYKIWKNLYYSAEDSLTSAVRKSVNTGKFANHVEFILNSYLQYLKFQNAFLTYFMNDSPSSSKQDVARVAELVVSLENKLDNLEGEWEEKLTDIENSTQFTEQIITQADFPASLAAIRDISNRVSELEQMIKKVETNLTEINKSMKAEPKKKASAASALKASKSAPKSDQKE